MGSANVEQLITDHIDLWTSAIENKSSSGRGSSKKQSLYGIKKLRELILDLAVRGKLVPQNPNDEPASVLLERITEERVLLVKDKKIKRPKKLPEITADEEPFQLPAGWQFVRFQEIISISSGGGLTAAKMNKDGSIPVFGGNGVTGYHDKGNVTEPTLVIGRVGFYCGSIHITPSTAWVTDNAFITDYSESNIRQEFLYWLLKGTNLKENENATAQPVISGRKVYPIVVAIPPYDEQQRIVAKVDELMALCDQLEEQTENNIEAHQVLVETLLGTLTQSQNADELAENWERVAEHFDTLFTTEHSIDQLKQTILQLAVMGKLVPQNSNDEPASAILSKIGEEKAFLIEEKKIKKQKALPAISPDEKYFTLPNGWEWCYLDDLSLSSEAGWSPQCIGTPREGNGWGVLKVSAVSWGAFQPEENKALPPNLEPRPQYEVKSGDFLISRANTAELVAKAVVLSSDIPSNLMMSDKIIRFKFSNNVSSEYLNHVNNCQNSRDYYSKVAGGTSSSMKNVSRNQIRSLLIPLPPLAEQLLIVEKVNQLYSLCDHLLNRIEACKGIKVVLSDCLVTRL